jgi:predicted phosphoadenosine phosphosulfate sulfurtransferase
MDEVIVQFEKNATEVVRVSLTEYRGHKLVDLRVYYSDDEGQYRPTKKGIALAVGLYAEFKRAMQALEKTLLERNLITQEDLEEVSVTETEHD